MGELIIKGLRASAGGKEILRGIDLTVRQGETHAIMGPNGSGKSTLSHVLAGHPGYRVDGGEVLFGGESLLGLTPDERARRGLFLAFQYPVAVPGVSVANFLRTALLNVRKGNEGDGGAKKAPFTPREFRKLLREKMAQLQIDEPMVNRYLNDGFSGGEKKRIEILQMAVLQPRIAVLDETDSGLDIDALRTVSEGVNTLAGPGLGLLVITHYQRILNYIKPQFVHVMMDGRIVRSAGSELAEELEQKGYDWIKESLAGVLA